MKAFLAIFILLASLLVAGLGGFAGSIGMIITGCVGILISIFIAILSK
jgi:hypothetical protein